MADKKSSSKSEAAPAAQGAPQGQAAAPSIQVIAQYVKDSSFESPNAPESLISGWPAPETTVQIGLNQRQLKDNLFESSISLRVEAKNEKEKKVAFIAEVLYGGMVALSNIPVENISAVLAVEVPKLLFPFAREVIGSMTAKGGFPPLYLTPISFEALYVNELKRLQAEQEKQTKKA